MAKHLGESGGESLVSQILSVLSGFVILLREAIKKHDEREEAAKRKLESAKKKQQQVTPTTVRIKNVLNNVSPFAGRTLGNSDMSKMSSLMASVSELVQESHLLLHSKAI
jgi:S-adenosylmethionine/arginine decarboxylase-like enzyme